MQFVHVSKEALPQKAQGGFVTASLAALLLASSSSTYFFFVAASSFLDAISLILASSSSASFFFCFDAATSLHAVLWTAQCSTWQAREQ